MSELMIDALIPYVLTTEDNARYLNFDDLSCELIDIADPSNQTFCDILNHTNQLAFGGPSGMGMPKWVMLDCAILGSAMTGFMIPADEATDALKNKLGVSSAYTGMIPISEYSASYTARPNCVTGFSLQTQIENQGVGTRTKALGLAVLDANRVVGVTQFDSPAIRTHCNFGRLKIEINQPIVHTYPEKSFVYSLKLPPREDLVRMTMRGEKSIKKLSLNVFMFEVDNEAHRQKLSESLAKSEDVWIVSPGYILSKNRRTIPMIFR